MFNLASIPEQAADLLHGSNAADLTCLAVEDAMTMLEERGIELGSLGDGVGLEQINAVIRR